MVVYEGRHMAWTASFDDLSASTHILPLELQLIVRYKGGVFLVPSLVVGKSEVEELGGGGGSTSVLP